MVYRDAEYDLVFIAGDNGNAGYAYASELAGTEYLLKQNYQPKKPFEDEPAEDSTDLTEDAETVTVNVYRKDGKTLIDTATVRKVS